MCTLAGLVLVPFAVSGVAGGWLAHRGARGASVRGLLAVGVSVMVPAYVLFAVHHTTLAAVLVAITVLGTGVGAFHAIVPVALLRATPRSDTAATMSVNQLVRTLGFTCGSAFAGLVLATMSPPGAGFPVPSAYTVAAWIGAATMTAAVALCRGIGR